MFENTPPPLAWLGVMKKNKSRIRTGAEGGKLDAPGWLHGHLGPQLLQLGLLVVLDGLLLCRNSYIHVSTRYRKGGKDRLVLRSVLTGEGILCTASATGTFPVFDICSSSCSCCNASSSSSSSISSIGSPTVCPVMALTISSLRAFSSRNLSLQSEQRG